MSSRLDGPVIAVGVDGSDAGNAALRWAIRTATRQHGSVRAITVLCPDTAPAVSFGLQPRRLRLSELDEASCVEHLRELIERARSGIEDPAPVFAVTVTGDPERDLAGAAADADMLVVGGHGKGPLTEVFLGNVAAGAVRHAPCPVVVLPTAVADRYPDHL
jgi:nucleotide-binding universal stress UspA family protein